MNIGDGLSGNGCQPLNHEDNARPSSSPSYYAPAPLPVPKLTLKQQLEEIWNRRHVAHPCHWNIWLEGGPNVSGYFITEDVKLMRGRLTYPAANNRRGYTKQRKRLDSK